PHPMYKNLTVHTSSIEMSTENGSYARAVFAGEVFQIQVNENNRNWKAVYVRHGDFITIYMNLSSVNVVKGQKVSIKQKLGTIHTDTSGSTTMKFAVLQNTTYLNPELWLN
ncbi:MAG: M23 family metallopeptidase, partial [Flavobacterium sp.]|nr:M23 family metallopeptidase [Flavobacterium sp.]